MTRKPHPNYCDPALLLENLSTAVVVTDAETRILSVNPAAEMLFAQSGKRLAGQPLSALVGEGCELVRLARRVLEEGIVLTEREADLHLPGPRHFTVDCSLTPLDATAAGSGLLIELVQIDRRLRITQEELLLEQGRAVKEMVRGLAHEIKNPLGGLRGAAQLLQGELEDEALKEYTRIIIDEADRLRELVNRMLGPSAMPRMRELNLHEVLEHVRTLVLAEGHPELRILRDYDPSIPELRADRDALIQAVLNIVRNAVEAMEGRGTIRFQTRTERQFTIGAVRHRLVACVRIIDDGPGIPPALRERLFLPMVTGRPEGTGLGLSIAQSILNRHGGIIECTSRPGHTEFNLLIPLETK